MYRSHDYMKSQIKRTESVDIAEKMFKLFKVGTKWKIAKRKEKEKVFVSAIVIQRTDVLIVLKNLETNLIESYNKADLILNKKSFQKLN